MRLFRLLLMSCLIAPSTFAAQSGPEKGTGSTAHSLRLNNGPSQQFREQQKSLHENAVKSGGRLVKHYQPNSGGLAHDLSSLFQASDEVLLAHVVKINVLLTVPNHTVCTEYEMLVLRSWKGTSVVGDLIRVRFPAGGYAFPDGVQVEQNAAGLKLPNDGERHILFLSKSVSDDDNATFWLTGSGVQGAFLLDKEKVTPAYRSDTLAAEYSGVDVPAFLQELEDFARKQP